MPSYEGTIIDNQLHFVRPDLLEKWLEKNAGLWFEATLKILGPKDKKTAEQLGYYWGLLLPEIHRQLIANGITSKSTIGGIEREIPITKDDAHEYLTDSCGRIGPNGELMRLSDERMDKHYGRLFIDNVLSLAVDGMGMNKEKLEAWRPVRDG